jgi:hypothetical protein
MPGEEEILTQVRITSQAVAALSTGYAGIYCHALALLGHPGELVAEDQRPIQARIADATLMKPVQVRSTKADRLDVEERLTRSGKGIRLLVDAQVTETVKAKSSHCRLLMLSCTVPGLLHDHPVAAATAKDLRRIHLLRLGRRRHERARRGGPGHVRILVDALP